MLHLIPLAGPGREVTHSDGESRVVGQPWELHLPLTKTIAVAAPTVSGDEKSPRLGIEPPPFSVPPSANRRHREGACVVVNSYRHEARVSAQIVDAVRIRPRHGWSRKVVHIDPLRRLCLSPLLALVLVVAEDLLLLRVDRDHRPLRGQRFAHLFVDVLKLSIAIWMAAPLVGLPVALK